MKNINADELKQKIDSGEKITIIDVRTVPELSRGFIKNSINISLDEFENEIETKVPDKDAQVYLYCLSGSRSSVAAQIMDSLGYKNVYNLTSGMLAWRNKHFPEINA